MVFAISLVACSAAAAALLFYVYRYYAEVGMMIQAPQPVAHATPHVFLLCAAFGVLPAGRGVGSAVNDDAGRTHGTAII